MDRYNALTEAGQRLGFFAYMTVMNGGRPFWPALLDGSRAVKELSGLPGGRGGSTSDGDPFSDTVPHEYQAERHRHIAA